MNRDYIYTDQTEFIKAFTQKKESGLEGVLHYELKSIYAEVLDRKFIDLFNPEKTCIAISCDKPFKFDEDLLIENVIKIVSRLKEYHLEAPNGIKENIGEYSLYENLKVDGFMLYNYSFDKEHTKDLEYFLRLTYTPEYYPMCNRHNVFMYGEKCKINWNYYNNFYNKTDKTLK